MRRLAFIVGLLGVLVSSSMAAAQTVQPPRNAPAVCPPDVKGTPPTIGSGGPDLSEKLADSKGVICPPAGVDPDIRVAPREGGEIKIIPPPGSPGGNPNAEPKP
jgi:hypothetical protein